MSQLDRGLRLSPQRLRGHKALEVKRLFPREQVIHRAPELVREDRERFGFAMWVFEFGKIRFAGLTLADEEHGGFGKGPASVSVADLVAGRAQFFATGFFDTLPQATIRDEILDTREASDIRNLIEEDQGQNLANPWH